MSKTSLAVGCGTASLGGIGVGAGVYVKYFSSDAFYDDFMDPNNSIYESAWKKKFKWLKDSGTDSSSAVTEATLLDVKKNHKSKSDTDDEAIKALKDACQEIKRKGDKDLVTSETKTTQLNDVIRYCIYTINEHITDTMSTKGVSLVAESSGSYTDEATFKKNYEKLFNESSGYTLDSDLSKIKKEGSSSKKDDKSEWEKIVNWCKSVIGKAYKGESDNLWKLSLNFCTKE